MKRLVCLLLLAAFATTAALYAGEVEIGLSVTPLMLVKSADSVALDNLYGMTSGFLQDTLIGAHAAYSLSIFYGSVDINVVPAWWVKNATEYLDDEGNVFAGIYAPGYVTYLDVGIRPVIKSIGLLAEAGINVLYVHSYYNQPDPETGATAGGRTGVNLRLGAGYKGKHLGAMLVGTLVFSSFEVMVSSFRGAFKGDEMAIGNLSQAIIPSVAVSVSF